MTRMTKTQGLAVFEQKNYGKIFFYLVFCNCKSISNEHILPWLKEIKYF